MSIQEKTTLQSITIRPNYLITYAENMEVIKDDKVISSSVSHGTIDPNYNGDGSELPQQVNDIRAKLYTEDVIASYNEINDRLEKEYKESLARVAESLSEEEQAELEKDLES